jgi:Skp family chaperone for outer membrane proteins
MRWVAAVLLGLAAYSGAGAAVAQTGARGKKEKGEPAPDPMAEIEKLKAEFEQRLADGEAAAKAREEAIRKDQAAAVEAARDEADKRMAADRNERQAEVLRLQKALEETAAREDARERNTPPAVKATMPGVSLYAYLQADYQLRQSSENQLDPSSGQPLNQDRFLIRRARLGVTLDRRFGEGRLEIDGNTVNGPQLRLFDAEASAKWPGHSDGAPPIVMGTIGLFRIPFGREVPQDDRRRFFMERSTAARALFPGEADLGARLAGGWHFVRYVLAVMNGQPLGSNVFPGLDPNQQKDIVGRLAVEESRGRIDFSGGVSGLRGTGLHPGNAATKPTLQWNNSKETSTVGPNDVSGSPGVAAGASSNYTRFAFGADLALSARLSHQLRTSFEVEFFLASDLDRGVFPADPQGALGRSLREMGYYLALIQEFGRWRLGVRYDYYNPDQDSNKIAKASPVPTDVTYSTLAVAAACVASWGRLIVEYDRNQNHLGINTSGMPANLADNALLVRGEVSF